MKFRSALLLACMLVVPAVAMFSHRIPADLRSAVRERVSLLVRSWAGEPVAGKDAETVLSSEPSPAAPQPLAAAPAVAAAPPSAGAAVVPEPLVVGAPAGERPRAEEILGRLGAVGLECRPLNGTAGMHVASCSVALDGSGQLLRVFHATGPDPAAATEALCDEVNGWKRRLADRSRAAMAPQPVTAAGAAGQRL